MNQDSAGVWLPPPLWSVGAIGIGLLLERWTPTTLLPRALVVPLGWALIVAWAVIAGLAMIAFRRAGTSVIPSQPSTALVTDGPFRFSRNPMYVGLALLHVGVTVLVDSLWPLVLLPAVMVVIRYHVVAREERYLEAKFGDSYRQYKSRVRRWM